MTFNLEHVIVNDPLVDQNRSWISTQMKVLGLEAQPAYIIKGSEGRLIVPYAEGTFEIRFTHDSKRQLANATISDGTITFFLTDYIQQRSDDPGFNPDLALKAKDLEESLRKAFDLFDDPLREAIQSRKLPNIPWSGDLQAIMENKLLPFMKNLGFSKSESRLPDMGSKYEFEKKGLKLVLTTAGRLDDGYVGILTSKGFVDYAQLLKKLSADPSSFHESVSRWSSGGYFAGDYYRIARIIQLTFPDILEKVIPKL